MTREALADKIRSLLDAHINSFIEQKSAAAIEAEKQFNELEKQKTKARDALGGDSAAYKAAASAIEKEQKQLDVDDAANRKANRQSAAEALIIAANHWRLPVALRKEARRGRAASTSSGSSDSGQRSRMSSDEMDKAASQVLAVLPPSNTADANCKAPSAIADDAGLPVATVKSVLMKLKRDGKAESNGQRGLAGGWRRAKAS